MMKNRWSVATLSLLIALAPAVPAAAQDRVDLVVLLDSSQSMFPYYNQVVDYVVSGTIREYMRFGDGFHLISFADSTQVELAQVLRTEDDLKAVLARLYLLYPLGRNTDLVGALKNVHQYVSDLPEAGMKYIVLITDGMHSPSDGSDSAGLTPAEVEAELLRTAGLIRERGWIMRIVRVPFTAGGDGTGAEAGESPGGAPGAGNYLDTVAGALGTGMADFDPEDGEAALRETIALPRIAIPAELGERDYAFTLPFELTNPTSATLNLELDSLLLADGRDILRKKVFVTLGPGASASFGAKVLLPEDLAQGRQGLSLEPRFADGLRVSPARSETALELKKAPLAAFFRNTAMVGLFLGLLALALIILFVALRYVHGVHRRSERPIVEAVMDSQAAEAAARAMPSGWKADARDAAALLGSAAARPGRETADGARPSRDAVSRGAQSLQQAASTSAARDAAALLASSAARPGTERDAGSLLAGAASAERQAGSSRSADLLASWSGTRRAVLPTVAEAAASRLPAGSPGPAGAIEFRPALRKPGAARFGLSVGGQNPNIGSRNIKTMHAGGRKTVGGRGSDFLVFLLPVPARVADLYFDGENLTLVPVKRAFFPGSDGPIRDCMGMDIPMVTSRGRELVLRFERYVPPLEHLNKLLHCIDSPGVAGPTAAAVEGAVED